MCLRNISKADRKGCGYGKGTIMEKEETGKEMYLKKKRQCEKYLILASASPRRRELLAQIGLEFEIIPAKGDGETTETVPGLLVEELSRNKALEIAADVPEGIVVIGADTMVFFEDAAMGKPADAEAAARMLRSLQGKVHQVCTGCTLAWKEGANLCNASFHEVTDVEFFPMTEAEIAAYIKTGDPFDKAGAYGIQTIFARHVKEIRGDYNNVVGLPVGRLYQEMKKREMV